MKKYIWKIKRTDMSFAEPIVTTNEELLFSEYVIANDYCILHNNKSDEDCLMLFYEPFKVKLINDLNELGV